MLARVREGAAAAGRPEDAVTPGLYARVVVAETREEAEAAIDGSLLMRFIALTRPAEAFAARGAEHPLGEGAFGLTSFMPTEYGRAEALRLAEAVPPEVVRDAVIHGTPDEVARAVGEFVERGRPPRAAHQHDPARRPAAGGRQRGPAGRHRRRPAGGRPRRRVSRRALPVALALAAGAALAAAPAAGGATRTLTLEGWHDRALAFSGRSLVWTEAATVRVDPRRIRGAPPGSQRFDYYRADVSRARLDRASRRFAGAGRDAGVRAHEHRPHGLGHARPDRRRRLRRGPVLAPAAPADDLVLRRRGPRDGDRQRRPGRCPAHRRRGLDRERGALRPARRRGPPGAAPRRPGRRGRSRRRRPPSPGRPTSWRSPGATSAPGPTRLGPRSCWSPATASAAAPAAVALPGPALRVWAAPGLVAVLSRAGGGLAVTRVDVVGGGAPRAGRAWTGARTPAVAVGGGTLAIADGRRVLASRRSRPGGPQGLDRHEAGRRGRR